MAEILALEPEVLGKMLEMEIENVIIIDCRSFLSFNSGHISISHNIHCPPIVKRRSGGCLPMENIIRCETSRAKLLSGQFKAVVVYDENTETLDGLTQEQNLYIVIKSFKDMTTPVYFLKGGYDQFQLQCPLYCVHHASTESDSSESNPTSGWFTPGSGVIPTEVCESKSDLRDTIKYRPSQDQGDPEAVLPWLYLGSAYHAMQESTLHKAGITALLNMASKSDTLTPGPTFLHLRIPVDDSCTSDIGSWFPEAIDFVESVRKQGGKVLVHCRAGISRSATVCIAYIMWYKFWTMDKAYDFLKSKRSLIAPNLNFMRQLLEFERQLQRSGRCGKSSSTSTHSSSSSYLSTASCECEATGATQQQPGQDTPCQYCTCANTSRATSSFSFESHSISSSVVGGDRARKQLSQPSSPTGFNSSCASSRDFLHSLVGVPPLTLPFQVDASSCIQQPPRSASANLFSSSQRPHQPPPPPPLPHSPGVDTTARPISNSAKPVFNLPLTPCTKQATVFSFDSPICSPLSQHTNSPTMCHSPLVSPS